MRLIRKFVPLVFLASFAIQARAQQFWDNKEIGVIAGASEYFGDLNPNYGFKHIRPVLGAYFKYHLNSYFTFRGNALVTTIGYQDSYSKNAFQKRRNLNFTSPIAELSVATEMNFFRFETGNRYYRFTPYISVGVGAFYYNPMADVNGKKTALRPLGTEGQNYARYSDRKYHSIGVALPMGIGVKYWLAPGVNLSAQIVNRFTFSDYVDDVSQSYIGAAAFQTNPTDFNTAYLLQDRSALIDGQKLGVAGKKRGDSSTNDQYLIAEVSISFQLKTYKCPDNQRGNYD